MNKSIVFLVIIMAVSGFALDFKLKRKRQIFREQVLPHSGGKIPEDAFRSDRLALNRLNKEGIAIPDGILLEARHHDSHHNSHRHDPDISASIIKLVQTPDGRYAPSEGHYPFDNLIDSTYIIRQPFGAVHSVQVPPRKPIHTTLRLPARPFFASEEELLNLSNQIESFYTSEIPGTRIWTSLGTLFHETPGRILREVTPEKVADKPEPVRKVDNLFPNLTAVPQTGFSCVNKVGRMVADTEANCQAFHICHSNTQKESFLCPQGTRFDAAKNQCSNWKEVICNAR